MSDLAYSNYWERKRLLRNAVPHFPVLRWWPSDTLCELEKHYFAAVKSSARLLDVGAGDLRVMRKLQSAGFRGEYHTQDVGGEYKYTYTDLSAVDSRYDAILCMDVIEHLPLEPGLELIQRLLSLLEPGGVLILQTPNGKCVRNPLAWDMTHLHMYNLNDLWAYLTVAGLVVSGYRVQFVREHRSFRDRLWGAASAFVASWLLHGDYADNIAVFARRPLSAGVISTV